ncbi:MAG TPA: response regulator transcription factor [Terriglobia bacterium]|nr:response regulator transcription factor [Terriglobia bacterium]
MNRTEEIRVLVVDDHPIVRLGLAAFINAQPKMKVIAQAGTGEEAVELFRHHQPDVVLMDLRLPGMSGVDAIRVIRSEYSQSRFVVMTTYEGDEDIYQALEAGAQAYLIKCMEPSALVDAVLKVHAGLRVIPASVAKNLAARTPNSALTDRERDVLGLIVKGQSNKEIAAELGITEGTVKCHVNVILSRLGVNDRTEAAVAALKRGMVHF